MQQIKKRIENIDFSFINYIREETRSFSNKVIFFSSIIILISFKVIAIKELDFDGFKVDVKDYILLALIFIVNVYFFLQFYNSIKIDVLLATVPAEISSITDDLLVKSQIATSKVERLAEEFKIAKDSGKFDKDTQRELSEQIDQLEKDETETTLEYWLDKSTKFLNHHQQNQNLNVYFPMVWFIISALSICIKIALSIKEIYCA